MGNIKQKIWLIPGIAVVVGSASIATNYVLLQGVSSALTKAGKVDYPALKAYEQLIGELNGIQENLTNAVSANDKNALALAEEKVRFKV